MCLKCALFKALKTHTLNVPYFKAHFKIPTKMCSQHITNSELTIARICHEHIQCYTSVVSFVTSHYHIVYIKNRNSYIVSLNMIQKLCHKTLYISTCITGIIYGTTNMITNF